MSTRMEAAIRRALDRRLSGAACGSLILDTPSKGGYGALHTYIYRSPDCTCCSTTPEIYYHVLPVPR